jgi:hypothetical protein
LIYFEKKSAFHDFCDVLLAACAPFCHLLLIDEKTHLLVIDGGTDASPSNPRNAPPDGQRAVHKRTKTMTRTITSFLAAALIAGSATLAFASDNGDGAMTQDSIRNTQRGAVTAQSTAPAKQIFAGTYSSVSDAADHSARSAN